MLDFPRIKGINLWRIIDVPIKLLGRSHVQETYLLIGSSRCVIIDWNEDGVRDNLKSIRNILRIGNIAN